jgi:ribose/xylose/arabinose/galactoside ABC-type transport system permease subunit
MTGTARRFAYRLGAYQAGGLLVALLVMSAIFTATSGPFLTQSNLLTILLQVSVVGLVAIPGAMLVLTGYVDLSVGSVAVLSAAVFGQMAKVAGLPLAPAITIALLVGAAWGLLNGVLICYFRFSPIIVTLGGFAGARGLAEAVTKDVTQFGFGKTFSLLGNGTVHGMPVPALIFIVVFLIGAYMWYEMPAGRHMAAIGSDKIAARALGVQVRRVPAMLYVLSGAAAAAGGLILTSELDGASVSIGLGLELEVLTAVLLGGVAFSGGRGSLWGVLFGILFVGVLDDGLILINVGPYLANVAIGGVLLAAAGFDVIYQLVERIPVTVEEEPDSPTGPTKNQTAAFAAAAKPPSERAL